MVNFGASQLIPGVRRAEHPLKVKVKDPLGELPVFTVWFQERPE